jgi:flagellar biosynthetic protein FliR
MNALLPFALPQFDTLMVVLFRLTGILAVWPVIGSRTIPAQVKVVLVVMLALVLMPLVHLGGMPQDPLLLTMGMFSESLVGLVIGLCVRFLFAGFELAGELMGTQMGLGVVQLLDPTSSRQIPLIGNFNVIVSSLIFLGMNAHLWVIRAVANSFDMIPPFGAGLSPALMDDVLHLSQGMFVVALKLSAPVMATILLINLLLAILGRTVPQLNVFAMSFVVTILGGLVALGTSLPWSVTLYQDEFVRLQDTIDGVMRVLGQRR